MLHSAKRLLGALLLVAGLLGASPAEAHGKRGAHWGRRVGQRPIYGWAHGRRNTQWKTRLGTTYFRSRRPGFGTSYSRGRRARYRTYYYDDSTPRYRTYYYPGYRGHRLRYRRAYVRDFDCDGIPDSRDRDIDGDGVRNRRDRYDWNPLRW